MHPSSLLCPESLVDLLCAKHSIKVIQRHNVNKSYPTWINRFINLTDSESENIHVSGAKLGQLREPDEGTWRKDMMDTA